MESEVWYADNLNWIFISPRFFSHRLVSRNTDNNTALIDQI